MAPPSGERFVPGQHGPGMHLEHLHRYGVAASLVRGRVLDLGCGLGYGSRILASEAGSVVGLDIAGEAVGAARGRFGSPQVRFVQGDVQRLPLASRSFDSVVCFELIEHVRGYEATLDEIRRVLRPKGLLLISSPNRPEYTDATGFDNPFHTQEWDREQFADLLRSRFPHVHLWGQRLVAGSRIWDPQTDGDTLRRVEVGAELDPSVPPEPDPMYFLGLCSTRPIEPEEVERVSSVLAGRLGAFVDEEARRREGFARDAAEAYEAEIVKLRDHLAHYQAQNAELQSGREGFEMQLLERDHRERENEARLDELTERLEKAKLQHKRAKRDAEAARVQAAASKARARDEHDQLEKERQGLRATAEELRRLEASRAEVAARLEAERARRKKSERQADKQQRRAEKLVDEVRETEKELLRTSTRLEAENSRRKVAERAAESDRKRLEKELERLRALDAELAGLRTDLRVERLRRETAERDVAAARNDLADLRALEARTARLKDELAGKLARTREDLEASRSARERLDADARRLRARWMDENARRSEAEAALAGLREESDRRANELEQQSAQRQQDIEHLLDQLTAERAATASANEQVASMEAQAAAMEAQAAEAWQQLAQEQERRTAAEADAARGWAEAARGWDEVVAIHATKVWKISIFYGWLRKTFRRPLALPMQILHAIVRGLRATGRWIGGLVARAWMACYRLVRYWPRPLGWLYLLVNVAWTDLRARFRPHPRPSSLPATPAGTKVFAKTARRPRALLVCPYPIYPADHGGGVRLFNLVKRLAAEADLHILIFIRADDDPVQREALAPYCVGVHFHHWKPRGRPDFFGLTPPNAQIFSTPAVSRRIRGLVERFDIDLVQLEYAELGQYVGDVGKARVVITEHDIARQQHKRRRKLAFHKRFPEGRAFGASFLDVLRIGRYELDICRRADRVLVMSEDDGAFLAPYLKDGVDRVRVVPNAVDTAFYAPPKQAPKRKDVLFVGNYQNLPNIDALEFFLRDVWPMVRLECPDAKLSVVGANPSDRVLALDGRDGVSVVGRVEDLRKTYHEHKLLVAPLRVGSGTRLKILEAFAAGIPVVSTTLGAEGIEKQDGEDLLVEDTARGFARAVVRLLGDDQLCERLASNALRLVEERYDWDVSARSCLEAWREILPGALEEDAAPAVPRSIEGGAGVDISVVLPTWNGGEVLERSLEAIFAQETERSFEVICVDSGSRPEDLERMKRFPIRLYGIDQKTFNHGLTRDLGADLATGRVLVFLNQDAVPCDSSWLKGMTEPLLTGDESLAAIQGGIQEFPHPTPRFFWDSCGDRFYFTSESTGWIGAYGGIGFSTVNAAMRRDVWSKHRFGWAPIMEDKIWQQAVVDAGCRIEARYEACVYHTHDYDMRSLVRRCQSEGYGWRTLGETYTVGSMIRDLARPRVYADLAQGLFRGRVRKPSELLFPILRPLTLFHGNRLARSVKL